MLYQHRNFCLTWYQNQVLFEVVPAQVPCYVAPACFPTKWFQVQSYCLDKAFLQWSWADQSNLSWFSKWKLKEAHRVCLDISVWISQGSCKWVWWSSYEQGNFISSLPWKTSSYEKISPSLETGEGWHQERHPNGEYLSQQISPWYYKHGKVNVKKKDTLDKGSLIYT